MKYTPERVALECAKAIYAKTALSQNVAYDLLPRDVQKEMQDVATTVLAKAEEFGWRAP
jgi:hypothetical protein